MAAGTGNRTRRPGQLGESRPAKAGGFRRYDQRFLKYPDQQGHHGDSNYPTCAQAEKGSLPHFLALGCKPPSNRKRCRDKAEAPDCMEFLQKSSVLRLLLSLTQYPSGGSRLGDLVFLEVIWRRKWARCYPCLGLVLDPIGPVLGGPCDGPPFLPCISRLQSVDPSPR